MNGCAPRRERIRANERVPGLAGQRADGGRVLVLADGREAELTRVSIEMYTSVKRSTGGSLTVPDSARRGRRGRRGRGGALYGAPSNNKSSSPESAAAAAQQHSPAKPGAASP